MDNSTKNLKDKIVSWIETKKAENIEVIDVTGLTSYTDVVVICSASVELHVKAIADHVLDMAKTEKLRLLSKEGLDSLKWVLLDFGEIILHIFNPESRKFYNLEDFLKSLNNKNRKDEQEND